MTKRPCLAALGVLLCLAVASPDLSEDGAGTELQGAWVGQLNTAPAIIDSSSPLQFAGQLIYGRFHCTIESGYSWCGVGSLEAPVYNLALEEPRKVLVIQSIWTDISGISGDQHPSVMLRVRWLGKRPPQWPSILAYVPIPLSDYSDLGEGARQYVAHRLVQLYTDDAIIDMQAWLSQPTKQPALVNFRFTGVLVPSTPG